MDFDVIVLGAGIVGVSSALHLQDRGRRVALVDRRGPGEETSFGNAGLIERSSVVPYGFPRDLGTLLRYMRNRVDRPLLGLQGLAVFRHVARAVLVGVVPGTARGCRARHAAVDPRERRRARRTDRARGPRTARP